MGDYNHKIVANGRDQGVLLNHISNYIKQVPLRRPKRSGSLGLSNNSIRNLKRFYDLIQEFESDQNCTL
jgi:hypothetical protein